MQWEMFWAGAYIVPAIWTALMSYAWLFVTDQDEALTLDGIAESALCGLFWPLLRVMREPM